MDDLVNEDGGGEDVVGQIAAMVGSLKLDQTLPEQALIMKSNCIRLEGKMYYIEFAAPVMSHFPLYNIPLTPDEKAAARNERDQQNKLIVTSGGYSLGQPQFAFANVAVIECSRVSDLKDGMYIWVLDRYKGLILSRKSNVHNIRSSASDIVRECDLIDHVNSIIMAGNLLLEDTIAYINYTHDLPLVQSQGARQFDKGLNLLMKKKYFEKYNSLINGTMTHIMERSATKYIQQDLDLLSQQIGVRIRVFNKEENCLAYKTYATMLQIHRQEGMPPPVKPRAGRLYKPISDGRSNNQFMEQVEEPGKRRMGDDSSSRARQRMDEDMEEEEEADEPDDLHYEQVQLGLLYDETELMEIQTAMETERKNAGFTVVPYSMFSHDDKDVEFGNFEIGTSTEKKSAFTSYKTKKRR
jgi:hypothetical protein